MQGTEMWQTEVFFRMLSIMGAGIAQPE